jgi:tetratricopeptide (TPR) repeat protein
MLGDALLANGMYDESRAALKQGIAMNESAEKNPQLPAFLLKDVQGRLADLYAALGELERKTENFKQSLRCVLKLISCGLRMLFWNVLL